MKNIFYSLFPQNRRESKKFNIKLSLLFTSTQNGKIFPNDFFGSSDNHSSLPLIIPDHVNKKEFNQNKIVIDLQKEYDEDKELLCMLEENRKYKRIYLYSKKER